MSRPRTETERWTVWRRKANRKALAGGRARLWNLPRGWAHQGFFYLDRTQRIGRVVFEIVPTVILAGLIGENRRCTAVPCLALVCQPVPRSYPQLGAQRQLVGRDAVCVPEPAQPGGSRDLRVPQSDGRSAAAGSLHSGAMIFGSVARGQWHERSDLDVRLLRRPGVRNGVTGVLILAARAVDCPVVPPAAGHLSRGRHPVPQEDACR